MLYVLENEQISIESAEAQSSAAVEESTEAQSSAAAEESTEAQSSAAAEESTEAQSSAAAEESTEAQSSAAAEESTEAQSSAAAEESTEAQSSAAEESASSTESVISDGDNAESVEITEEPKEWPKGGTESFTNHALPSLVFGMLGIFLVLGLIAVATMALNKLFPGKKDN